MFMLLLSLPPVHIEHEISGASNRWRVAKQQKSKLLIFIFRKNPFQWQYTLILSMFNHLNSVGSLEPQK